MSPRSSTLLALAGVLLAGIPLPALTGERGQAAVAPVKRAPATHSVYATVHFSGQPSQLIIRHEGVELTRMPASEAAYTPWETELVLPVCHALELEVEASWPDDTQARAVTLSLEPPRLPQRQCTQWVLPGSPSLHSLFSFTW